MSQADCLHIEGSNLAAVQLLDHLVGLCPPPTSPLCHVFQAPLSHLWAWNLLER